MNGMDKREMIERALEQLWPGSSLEGLLALANRTFSTDGREAWAGELWSLLIDALAEQAIVVEVRVGHGFESDPHYIKDKPVTTLYPKQFDGHHGIPGEAIAIILSLEEEK